MYGGVVLKPTETSYEKVRAAFRFVGDNVNPEEITVRIGIQPSRAHAKGAIIKKHPERTHSIGLWGLDSPILPDRPLEEHLLYLLDELETQVSGIEELKELGLLPSFFCGFFVAGRESGSLIKLESDTLNRIARLGIPLELHIYCCDEDC
jgi:hypothetical protein